MAGLVVAPTVLRWARETIGFENVRPDLSESLPMLGSLNASFECLGAYHLWMRSTGEPDLIDEASHQCKLTASAIQGFYP